ncbi:MAG: hypothetical protein RJA34_1258 [Pseudomonadota bacterium]|jgi:pimeloyl-ACP methyl ester carboxylesterase
MYQVKHPSRSEFVPVRGLQYHVRIWGQSHPALPPLVMLHGWMDVAASFQFVVDALQAGRQVIAPDWRGFGLTRSAQPDTAPLAESFWHPDYLADLEVLLDHFVPGQVIDLLGHSMGGNIAMVYAGVRPERVRRLINLEGFGLPQSRPSQAPGRMAKWLDDVKAARQGKMALKSYDAIDGVVGRLLKTNPRLGADKATWLAQHWARQDETGRWTVLGEAGHKVTNAYLYRVDETLQIHQRITAPVLVVEAGENEMNQWWQASYTLGEFHERLKVITQLERKVVPGAGHMLHHDQPDAVAQLIENFLA